MDMPRSQRRCPIFVQDPAGVVGTQDSVFPDRPKGLKKYAAAVVLAIVVGHAVVSVVSMKTMTMTRIDDHRRCYQLLPRNYHH
jgi:hypothetical protein